MFTKRLYGLFHKSKGLKQSFSEATHEAQHVLSPAKYNSNKNLGSPFVRNLVKDEKVMEQYYENYLTAYNNALRHLAEQDYTHAEFKLREALSNLGKVDIVTPALREDFAKIAELSDLIQDSPSKKKC